MLRFTPYHSYLAWRGVLIYESYKIHLPSIEVLLLFLFPILIVIIWLCLAIIYFIGQLVRARLRKVFQLTFILPMYSVLLVYYSS